MAPKPAPKTTKKAPAQAPKVTHDFLTNITVTRLERFNWPGHAGLMVQVMPSGIKTWMFRYRIKGGDRIMMRIGAFGFKNMPKGIAETIASHCRIMCEQCKDPRKVEWDGLGNPKSPKPPEPASVVPVAGVLPGPVTIRTIAEDYYSKDVLKNNATSTAYQKRWMMDKYILAKGRGLGELTPEQATPRKITAFLDDIAEDSAVNANRIRAFLSRMFNWASRRYDVLNPVTGHEKETETPRNIILSDPQIKKLGEVFQASHDPYKWAIILPLLCGARRGAVEHMSQGTWDGKIIRYPAGLDGVKGCEALFLNDPAMFAVSQLPVPVTTAPAKETAEEAETRIRRVHEALKRCWERMRLDAGFVVKDEPKEEDPGLHDLRRTFSTKGIAMKLSPILIDVLQDHSQGKIRDTYQIWPDQMLLEASQQIGQRILDILGLTQTDISAATDLTVPPVVTPSQQAAKSKLKQRPAPGLRAGVRVTEEILDLDAFLGNPGGDDGGGGQGN